MVSTDAITLRPVPRPAHWRRKWGWPEDSQEPYGEVLMHGESTGRVLQAGMLHAALQEQDEHLLLTSNGESFEDSLSIVLLSPRWRVLDKASIGYCYEAGIFENAAIDALGRISFRYLGPWTWQVRVLARSSWRIPGWTEPSFVWRRFGFRRRFVVSRTPLRSGAADAT